MKGRSYIGTVNSDGIHSLMAAIGDLSNFCERTGTSLDLIGFTFGSSVNLRKFVN